MDTRKLIMAAIVIIIVLIGAYILITNWSSPAQQEQAPQYIEVTDYAGRTVKVPTNVSRIVAIGPGMLRLVCYLNAVDMLAGVENAEKNWNPVGRDYAMVYFEKFKNLPVIGPGGPREAPNPELLRSVKPDLVIMSRVYVDLYDPDRLSSEVGAPVIVLDYGVAGYLNTTEFKKAITLLGKVLRKESRAAELASYIDSLVSDLESRVKGVEQKPGVYVGAVSYKGAQPFTATQGKFPPLSLLKTPSIADETGKTGFISLDFEFILKKQPEYVFIDLNNLKTVLDDFNKDKAKYCSLNAFKSGKVYAILPFNYYHTNVATAIADAYFIGKVLYPDKFKDVDPAAKADEIYSKFLGKPLYQDFVTGLKRGFGDLSDVFKC